MYNTSPLIGRIVTSVFLIIFELWEIDIGQRFSTFQSSNRRRFARKCDSWGFDRIGDANDDLWRNWKSKNVLCIIHFSKMYYTKNKCIIHFCQKCIIETACIMYYTKNKCIIHNISVWKTNFVNEINDYRLIVTFFQVPLND